MCMWSSLMIVTFSKSKCDIHAVKAQDCPFFFFLFFFFFFFKENIYLLNVSVSHRCHIDPSCHLPRVPSPCFPCRNQNLLQDGTTWLSDCSVSIIYLRSQLFYGLWGWWLGLHPSLASFTTLSPSGCLSSSQFLLFKPFPIQILALDAPNLQALLPRIHTSAHNGNMPDQMQLRWPALKCNLPGILHLLTLGSLLIWWTCFAVGSQHQRK